MPSHTDMGDCIFLCSLSINDLQLELCESRKHLLKIKLVSYFMDASAVINIHLPG